MEYTFKREVAKQLVVRGLLLPENVEPWLDTESLGSGYYASVFPLGDHRVVKVTEDRSDAQAAVHVRRLQQQGGGNNLVYVHAVFQMDANWWIIVNERCDKLPDAVEAAVNQIYGFNGFNLAGYDYPSDYYTRPENAALSNVKAIGQDLRDAGIDWFTDFHCKNVMWRHERWNVAGGRVVLTDFGTARSPKLDEIAA